MSKSIHNPSIGWRLDQAEMLLIRAGHHLWREYKANQREIGVPGPPNRRQEASGKQAALEMALKTVWQAKREYRAPFQAAAKARATEARARLAKGRVKR